MNACIERLGWMLLHSLWQGVAIWFLLQVALLVLRRKSAQARYLAACCALTAMACLPWLTFGAMDLAARLRSTPASMIGASVRPANTSAGSAVIPSSVVAKVRPPDLPNRWKLPLARRSFVQVLFPWLVSGWLLGVTVFSIRLLLSWRAVRRLVRTRSSPLPAAWQLRLVELCRLAGVRVGVRVGETPAVIVPLVVGWLKPVILLPLGVLAQLPAAQVEAILLHELAHIRRHDFLVNLLQSVVETLFFYHPAVRSISGRLREERERVCDDLSVEWCQDRVVYAEALTTFEEFRRRSLALAVVGEGDLLGRVRRIVLGIEPQQRLASLFAAAGFLAMGIYLGSMFFVPLLAAELMTDQERVAKIGSLQPSTDGLVKSGFSLEPAENVLLTGTLKTEDGQPLPKSIFDGNQTLKRSEARVTSRQGGGWSAGGLMMNDPPAQTYYGNTLSGRIEVDVWAEGYAPLRRTILQSRGGDLKADLTLRRGFPATVQITDASGQALGGVTLTAASSHGKSYDSGIVMPAVQTDAGGMATFGNVESDSEIQLNAFKPGWQMKQQTVKQWSPQKPLVWQLEAAKPTSGTVVDQITRQPIAGAEIILAARRGPGDSYVTFTPENGQVLGQSDEKGRFHLASLALGPGYYIYVQAAGYVVQSFAIDYGQQDRECALSPGLHLRGKILDPKGVLASKKYYHPIELQVMFDLQATPFNGYGRSVRQTLGTLGPEIPFSFEHIPPGVRRWRSQSLA